MPGTRTLLGMRASIGTPSAWFSPVTSFQEPIMLTREENDLLRQVGPGTAMGELMRRYWHPIAAVAELDDLPIKPTLPWHPTSYS